MLKYRIGMATAALLISTSAAFAGLSGTVDGDYDSGQSYGRSGKFVYNGNRDGTIAQISYFDKTASTGDGNRISDPFWGFCIDLFDGLTDPDKWNVVDLELCPEDEGGPMGVARANYIRELWADNYASVNTNDEAAAFQLAVWEIIYEDYQANGLGITDGDGDFFASQSGSGTLFSNTVVNLTNSWLGALNGQGPRASLAGLTSRNQDFVTELIVPAPGAVLLGLTGLVGIGWMRRRPV